MESNKNGSFKPKKVYFSQVSNTALRDKKLSLQAKGLYSLIQSYLTIENFTLYKNHLEKQSSNGKSSFDSAWKELKNAGYLIQEKHNDGSGHFYYMYDLLDVPHTDFPGVVKPGMENRGHIVNNDLNNTDSINTNNNFTSFINDDSLHNLDELNYDEYIFSYLKIMKEFGYKHKRVNENNYQYILNAISEIRGHGIDIDDWEDKVTEHFENLPKNNDGDILAFLKAASRYFEINIDYLVRAR